MMALKRSHDESVESGGIKKQKTGVKTDPKSNPYLAHMYPGSDSDSDGGVPLAPTTKAGLKSSRHALPKNGDFGAGAFSSFQRHKTSSEQAKRAEDGPTNPFTGTSLSQAYFSILKTRRNLPVHAQRYVARLSP